MKTTARERIVTLALNESPLLPRGTKRFLCAGITKGQIEQVQQFLCDETWFQEVEEYRISNTFQEQPAELPFTKLRRFQQGGRRVLAKLYGKATVDGWLMEGTVEVCDKTLTARTIKKNRKDAEEAIIEALRSDLDHLDN